MAGHHICLWNMFSRLAAGLWVPWQN